MVYGLRFRVGDLGLKVSGLGFERTWFTSKAEPGETLLAIVSVSSPTSSNTANRACTTSNVGAWFTCCTCNRKSTENGTEPSPESDWIRVYGLWFMVYGLWFMVYGLGFAIYGQGLGFMV